MPWPPHRWRIVLALFVVTFGVSIPLAAYGVFLPILAEVFGWSRGAVASALSINLVMGGVAGLAVGAVADRHGPRLLLVLTVALAGAAFALVSTVHTLWQLDLLVGVLGGIGMSSFYVLAAATITRWFEDRRGLPLALVLMGFNTGYISAGPLAAGLIARLGWRPAYAVLGAGAGLVATLAALAVRLPREGELTSRRPRPGAAAPAALASPVHGPGITLGQALADPRQWALNASWLLLGGLLMMLSVHAVPFARDRGLPLAAASLALTAYGIGAMSGRITSGAVSDRIGTGATIRAAYAIQMLALLTILWMPSHGALLGALTAFGVGAAAADTMFARVVPDVFGVRAVGGILGVLSLGWRCGAGVGPAAAGFFFDLTGSYTIPFGAAPVVLVVSWGLFRLGSRRHPRPG